MSSRRKTKLRLVSDTKEQNVNTGYPSKFEHERVKPPLVPLTEKQGEYLKALNSSEQVIVMGCAGTGKTYISATHAADLFRKRKIKNIYITRPNVAAGRSIGFFPGDLNEKMANWVLPLTNVIKNRIGSGAFEIALTNGDIEIIPFETMRGRDLRNCVVILDEAQNTTEIEMKLFLTRIGENCQVIVNGDISQSDLKEKSGLATIIHMIKSKMMPIPIIEFTVDDIVRSGICEQWVRAFEEAKI